MAKGDDGGNLSVTMVAVAVGALVTFVLWGVACAMYDASQPQLSDILDSDRAPPSIRIRGGAVAGVATFVAKSISLLPHFPQVVGFVVRERFWFAVTTAIILAGVVLFGILLKRTEAALATPHYKRNRRR